MILFLILLLFSEEIYSIIKNSTNDYIIMRKTLRVGSFGFATSHPNFVLPARLHRVHYKAGKNLTTSESGDPGIAKSNCLNLSHSR